MLADRSNFMQSYSTNIVRCTLCGCVCRNSPPSPQAISTNSGRLLLPHYSLLARV